MNQSKVVITQPDFFPWLGAFDKFILADKFVFLDNVTNRPGDGIWTKRVKILINKEPKWLTVPLKKDPEREFLLIKEMQIDLTANFKDKHLKTIIGNYSKTPFFDEVYPEIEAFYNNPSPYIAQRNIDFILNFFKRINISRQVYLASELGLNSTRNQLLIDIVHKVKGDSYIYGKGSLDYLDFDLWNRNQIDLIAQDFIHPNYSQLNSSSFIPGLSIIDSLCNLGYSGVKRLLINEIS